MKKFAIFITTIVFKLIYRVELVNMEKVPVKGPAILCANHNSILDMFFLGFRLKRWIYWMAKEELFKNPIAAFILGKLGVFPVKRGKGDISSIKNAYKLLDEGKIVGIFPQGTRINPERIETMRVKPGAAMIALNAGVPIIPAAIQGSYKLFGKIRVIFGDPFYLEHKDDEKHTKDELKELAKDIIRRVYLLMEGRKWKF